jgi:3-hydroxyacyl-CoA dehydrogenase
MEINRIDRVAVIGAGIMGIGIAQNFAQAGLWVNLADINQEILDRAMIQVKANLAQFQEFGLLKEEVSRILARIKPVLRSALKQPLPECQYIVEVIPERNSLPRSKSLIPAALSAAIPAVLLLPNWPRA